MADLKTNYKDDVLNTEVNERRKYQMIQNDDGTVSFVDVTDYSQVGDSFGALDINATNEKCNELNNSLDSINGEIIAKVNNKYKITRNGNLITVNVSNCEISTFLSAINSISSDFQPKEVIMQSALRWDDIAQKFDICCLTFDVSNKKWFVKNPMWGNYTDQNLLCCVTYTLN